ncbi:NCL1 [Symbiodinium sp. KB8]|nr:NCL1 [Symbiodinium sp. KB8]
MGGVAWLPDAPRKPSALRIAVCLALFSSTCALSGPKPRQGEAHRHGWKWLSPSDEDAEQENAEQLKEYEAQKLMFTRASSLTMFPTKKGVNISSENSPFAKVRTKMVPVQPHNTFATAVDVEIATPEIIVSVYLLLYVPLAMAWAYFAHYGYQEKHYLILVPFTLCAFTVGSDLVNQSLSTLTAAPMALTTIQAGFCFVITALWTLGCQVYASFAGRVSQAQAVAAGRRVVLSGEVVMLRTDCGATSRPDDSNIACAGTKRGAPRMQLVCDPVDVERVKQATEGGLAKFRLYYRDLQLAIGSGDWEQCETLFGRPVPLSLRLNRSPLHAETLSALTEKLGQRAEFVPWMDESGGALHVVPTTNPDEAAAGLELVNTLASTGEVVVQDGLSMLPVVALDPQPGDAVLDLCSAPGSKACQLLDFLRPAHASEDWSLLVANDVRTERSERTWSRAKAQRCTPLLVTNVDGTCFPDLLGPRAFDRILVDAPCSSDGTIRKEPKRLQRWSVGSGLSHHELQLRLLRRGLSLLRPGGRLVYSTCSLNPLECEAVVQAALIENAPGVHLLPAEAVLPEGCPRGLPGLSTWRVPDPSFNSTERSYKSTEEYACGADVPSLLDTMFPLSAERSMELSLHHCARFLPIHGPHFGGFFLAVFTLEELRQPQTQAHSTYASAIQQPGRALQPLFPRFELDDPAFKEVVDFFGLCGHQLHQLVSFPKDVVSFIGERLLALSEPSADLAILHAGTPILHKMAASAEGVPFKWKICPEGAECLAMLATRRKVYPEEDALQLLLQHRVGPCSEPDGPVLLRVSLDNDTDSDREVWLSRDQSSKVPSELSLYPLSCGSLSYPLLRWTPAALWFVAYQLINHEVSLYCSLSERTIFLNLCPLFALFIEPLVLPSNISRGFNVTFSSKMSLITMAFGALLFSLQYPEFSANGARAAGLLVAVVLPYRLLQRMLLAECKEAPATLLCAFDGLLLTLPAGVLTTVNERFFLEAWNVWLHNPSIMLMLALSVFAFVGNHLAVLYLLKATSATSTLVFSNLSNFIVVFEGIVFFSDPVLQAPLVMAGIIFSLFGGVWYAVEQQESRKSFQETVQTRLMFSGARVC